MTAFVPKKLYTPRSGNHHCQPSIQKPLWPHGPLFSCISCLLALSSFVAFINPGVFIYMATVAQPALILLVYHLSTYPSIDLSIYPPICLSVSLYYLYLFISYLSFNLCIYMFIYLMFSCLVLSYLVVSCRILSYLVLSSLIFSYLLLSGFILSCRILSYLTLPLSYRILSSFVLPHLTIPYLALPYLI